MDYTKYLDQISYRFYGGANGSKKGIRLDDGKYYMIKFPPKPDRKNMISYTNSCISEYVACHIFESMGFNVQKTELGTVVLDGKEKVVVACQDFVEEGYVLKEFALIKNSYIESSRNGYGTELSEVLETIEMQNIYPIKELKEFFWELFIGDALLGNFDRHNGNWGFLINEELGDVKIAPVFDCGSCLYPQLSDEMIKRIISDKNEIEQRIYVFPNSALKIDDKKINMYDFLNRADQKDCAEALLRVFSRIDLFAIKDIISHTPYISSVRKMFYVKMIEERYNKLLAPAYQKALGKKVEIKKILHK